jgi:hypothetical protein
MNLVGRWRTQVQLSQAATTGRDNSPTEPCLDVPCFSLLLHHAFLGRAVHTYKPSSLPPAVFPCPSSGHVDPMLLASVKHRVPASSLLPHTAPQHSLLNGVPHTIQHSL